MTQFVHLHMHSQYSLLDGAIKIDQLVKKAVKDGMPAVALTDHGNMFGAVELWQKCRAEGIKPIIGSEFYIAPQSRFCKEPGLGGGSYHLVLLAQNATGYRNLCYLTSLGYADGFYHKPRIDKQLLQSHSEGLICLSGCIQGELARACQQTDEQVALDIARWYANLFPGSYYIELQDNGIPEQYEANRGLTYVAKELGLPLVATNDCHYLNREDAKAHDLLLCMQTGAKVTDEKRFRFPTDQFYVKTTEEMCQAFAAEPSAISNTVEIAERCNFDFQTKTYHFPEYQLPENVSLAEELRTKAKEGLRNRGPHIMVRRPNITAAEKMEYLDRLKSELACIEQMGFPGYFLVVADFINWAKSKGIPVGPGRGSAAGSLVAYCLGITDLDPIHHNLLFERFLNPERISMPDIDVDFCQERREEVIQYVNEKYGADRVCQIVAFNTLGAKGVIGDLARAYGIEIAESKRLAKLIPDTPGMTLEKAVKQERRLAELFKAGGAYHELYSTALKLEGLARHTSIHAAGLVISPKPMEEFCPTLVDTKSCARLTQYPMKGVETIGMVKFDFLGLKNLTGINNAVQIIRKKNPDFDIASIPENDEKTYKLLQSGNTTGVFQLESGGMRDLLTKLKPSCFEDIVAVCALYRPGPLGSGMVDDFVKRKHGINKVSYLLPQLEPILKDTYGVIVYQEQVMQIARTLAGYTLGGADLLRRAMGKKDADQMAKERTKFIAGAINNRIPERSAVMIFDLMAKFAEYGFNKSHSAAYALIAYQTAYLKANYPGEFMASLLSLDMGKPEKMMAQISDCQAAGLRVMPPDINQSDSGFTLVDQNTIRFGLTAVKKVGAGAVETIIAERVSNGRYKGLVDFFTRVSDRGVNKGVTEALVKAGAFDSTGESRARLLAGFDEATSMVAKLKKSKAAKAQGSLFEMPIIEVGTSIDPDLLPTESEVLAFEKDAIGFYLTGHPLAGYLDEMAMTGAIPIVEAQERAEHAEVKLFAMVSNIKEHTPKRGGNRMAFLTVEDMSGVMEVTVFASLYTPQVKATADGDRPVLITGTIEHDDKGAIKLKATKVSPM